MQEIAFRYISAQKKAATLNHFPKQIPQVDKNSYCNPETQSVLEVPNT